MNSHNDDTDHQTPHLNREENNGDQLATKSNANLYDGPSLNSVQASDPLLLPINFFPLVSLIKDKTYQLPADSTACAQSSDILKSKAFLATHSWKIENFSYYSREYIDGKKFSPLDGHETGDLGFKWSLEMRAKHRPDPNVNEEFVALYLRLNPTEAHIPVELKVTYLFAILDKDGKSVYKVEVDHFIPFDTNITSSWGRHRFISWNDLLENRELYLPSDTLTIYAKITALGNFIKESGQEEPICLNRRAKMNHDFDLLLESGLFADMTFVLCCDSENDLKNQVEFPAHKCIVVTRFPYFGAILSKDTNLNKLVVSDLEPEVFNLILRFVYSGKVELFDQFDKKLLIAANKFNLEPLKRICEKSLISKLSSEYVTELFIFATLHKAKYLKTKSINYIRKNPIEILPTSGWEKLFKDYTYLVKDIFNRHL